MAAKGDSEVGEGGIVCDTTDDVSKDLSRLAELVEREGVDIDQVMREVEKPNLSHRKSCPYPHIRYRVGFVDVIYLKGCDPLTSPCRVCSYRKVFNTKVKLALSQLKAIPIFKDKSINRNIVGFSNALVSDI